MTAAPRPFGADEDANLAVAEALADAYGYAERRKRYLATGFRNADAESRERAHVEALSAELDSRARRAHVAPTAFRDAVQVLIYQRHGREFSIAPLPKADAAGAARAQDLDVQISAADEQVAKLERALNTLRRKVAKAETDLRRAQIKVGDLHTARDRFRAAQGVQR